MKTTNQVHTTPKSQAALAYRVVFRGQFLDGHESSKVAIRLRDELGMSERAVRAFLSGKKFIVRGDLSKNKAIRMRAKLREVGLDVVANTPKTIKTTENQAPAKAAPEKTTPQRLANQTQKQLSPGLPKPDIDPVPSTKDSSRWVIAGLGVVFACAVIWLFFSI